MPIPDTSDASNAADLGEPTPFQLQPSPPAAKKRGRQTDNDPVRVAYARVINDLRFLTAVERTRVVRAVLSILDIDLMA